MLPLKDVPIEIAESLHYFDLHWTLKSNSKGGRTYVDRYVEWPRRTHIEHVRS